MTPSGAIQLNSSLLTLSVIAVLLPAAFHFVAGGQISDDVEGADVLAVSRGVSVLYFESQQRLIDPIGQTSIILLIGE